MDPNPKSFPILSYVMSKIPQLGRKPSFDSGVDIEQPLPSPQNSDDCPVWDHIPRRIDPEMLEVMTRAVSDISQSRSVLQMLGERPDHESVDSAKARIVEIEEILSKKMEEIELSPGKRDVDQAQWRSQFADEEREKEMCKAVVKLEEMHEAYEKLLKEAEEKLVKIYESAELTPGEAVEDRGEEEEEDSTVKEEVVEILHEALEKGLERVDLSGKRLRYMPEAFGQIRGLAVLNLSSNLLEFIPDAIAGLTTLEELNLSSNLLESLPDSIGLLHNLKFLNVSANKLNALPDSICHCRSLIELDASYNNLTYLPTNIGYELVNMKKLLIYLNKIRNLPSSICEMTSLTHLDVHFNELHGLPLAIGKLTNLEILNISSNFNDMTQLPYTFGDLINLKELDISNNQIHALPDTFGRLDSLVKLDMDQNPIVIPPLEVVNQGVEAVKDFMIRRWIDMLAEEERKSKAEIEEQKQANGWLTRSTSWLKGVSENVSEYLSPRAKPNADPFLDQQL